jgi:hypothetical protein
LYKAAALQNHIFSITHYSGFLALQRFHLRTLSAAAPNPGDFHFNTSLFKAFAWFGSDCWKSLTFAF